MNHLRAKRRKAALHAMAERYANRRFRELAERAPLAKGFEEGYRAAMSDVRKILTAVDREYPDRRPVARLAAIGFRIWRWVRPLR